MHKNLCLRILLIPLVFWHAESSIAQAVPSYQAETLYAIADVHGAYDEFIRLLGVAGITDDDLNWIAGSAHLVMTGDITDRGPGSRAALDLVLRLKEQAAEAGGMVHIVLGNHELLNITGDVHYVSDAAFKEFADDIDDDDRAIRAVVQGAWGAQYSSAAESFDEHYPPGFFAYLRAFSPNGEYGSMLLQQPWVVVVNDTAFVHGGLSSRPLNMQQAYDDATAYGEQWLQLVAHGLVEPRIGFFDHLDVLQELQQRSDLSTEVRSTVENLIELEGAEIFQSDSLVWYRGNAACAAVLELDNVDGHLGEIGATRAVLGHTPTTSHQVQRRLDDRVILLDTGMLASRYYGLPSVLRIEGDQVDALYADDGEWSPLGEEVRDVGSRRGGYSDSELEAWMEITPVTANVDSGNEAYRSVMLGDGEHEMPARWYPLKSDQADNAIATYRIDSMLGLELVPVTVRREIEGRDGVLQFVPNGTITEADRAAQGLPGAYLCDLGKQYELMYLLDILTYNQGRTPETIAYDPITTRLLLLGNHNTLSRKSGAPAHLKGQSPAISNNLMQRLQGLTDETLSEKLGDVLGGREISALLKRRDYLVEQAK